jgi:hypothetical protein
MSKKKPKKNANQAMNKDISERTISQAQYFKDFSNKDIKENALKHALDIRKFEIDLYWKRAAYFWTLIAATFAGYAAVQLSASQSSKAELLVVLSCLGFVFSFGWFCVNRGSKQWQENWENHVDMLENDVIGPLYKTVLNRPKPEGLRAQIFRFVTGPWPLSVSKINQIISLYVTSLWIVLLLQAIKPFSLTALGKWRFALALVLPLPACIAFLTLGKTHRGPHGLVAARRETRIEPAE